MILKKKVRIVVDILMFILFVLLMGYHIISDMNHEILGVFLFILFIIHHILNIKWYKTIFKGNITFIKVLFIVVNFLLLLAILGIIISGVLISGYVFSFLDIPVTSLGRKLHLFSTSWGFVLMGIHLGLHFKMMLTKILKKLKNSAFEYFVYLLIFIVVLLGMYAFVKNGYGRDMMLLTDFKFFDYEQSSIMFYLEQLSIMFCLSFITYGIVLLVGRKK